MIIIHFNLCGKWNSSGCTMCPPNPEGKFEYLFSWNRENICPRKLLSHRLNALKVCHCSLNLLSTSRHPRPSYFCKQCLLLFQCYWDIFFLSVNTFLEKPLIAPGYEDEICVHDAFPCALVFATWCQRCEMTNFHRWKNTHSIVSA